MAGSVNKVILIGNLGKDPEVRYLENGAVVANFPIATSETYTDKNGNRTENTDWHDVVVWRGLAEVAEKYLKKGMKIYVEGKLKKRSWQDKDGNTRYATEVVADDLTILTPKNETGSTGRQAPYSNEGTPPSPGKIDDIIQRDNSQNQEDDLPF